MIWFSHPGRRDFRPRREPAHWRWLLFAAAVLGATAAVQPWIRVRFTRLFDDVAGPPGWHTSAGFTLLSTSALLAVLALAETHTRTTRSAVRPASLFLAGLVALSLALHAGQGPGMLRGVSAAWTVSFYLALVAGSLLLVACAFRQAATRPRRDAPAQGPRQIEATQRGPTDRERRS